MSDYATLIRPTRTLYLPLDRPQACPYITGGEKEEPPLTLPSPTVGRGFWEVMKEGWRLLLRRRGETFGRCGSDRGARLRAQAGTRSGPSRFRGLSCTG